MQPPSSSGAGFAGRLAALYIAIFITGGFQLPFFPVWLKAKGLDAGEIGLVLATPMLVRVLAIPVATRMADRREALREAILVAAMLSVAGYFLVGLSNGFIAILLTFALASITYTPIMPLTETYALKGLAARSRAYGPVRLWGSMSFLAGTFLAGFASDVMPTQYLIWPIAAGTALVALAAYTLIPLRLGEPQPERPQAQKSMLRDPVFLAVVAGASLVQASHALYYGFSALAWRAQGFDGAVVAALWAIGVLAEILLFAVSARLPRFLTPAMLLIVGGLGGGLRWTAMAFDPPALALPFLQVLHALTFGAAHLGALGFLHKYAPPGQSATAQGYLAIAMGAVMAVTTGLSGVLFERFGSGGYAAMALAAIAGGACGFVAHRARREARL